MNLWLGVLIIGLLFVVVGFRKFFKIPKAFKNRKETLLIGISLPLFFAYSYGENLISHTSLQITLIDLGGLLVLGIISGIFIGCYFVIHRI
jgi:hypothetical protein